MPLVGALLQHLAERAHCLRGREEKARGLVQSGARLVGLLPAPITSIGIACAANCAPSRQVCAVYSIRIFSPLS